MSENFIGLRTYMSAALPATNTAAGFEALTWTEIGGLQAGFQMGLSHAAIDVQDLTQGFVRITKGMASGNESTATFYEVEGNTGQALAKTTGESPDGICSVRQVRCTGAANVPATGDITEYAQGVMHSYLPNAPTGESHAGFSVTFRQNAVAITDEYPA